MYAGLLAFSLVVSQVPLVRLPCIQGDSTLACKCKAGSPSACAALAAGDPQVLEGILRLAAVMKAAEEVQKKAEEEAQKANEESTDVVDTGCGGESPNDDQSQCTGQEHHIISKRVWDALNEHLSLRGLYRYRDPRFVAQAKDLKAHCGWQDWHRKIDEEIAQWIKGQLKLTPEQFKAYLQEVFSRPELRVRFPNGF